MRNKMAKDNLGDRMKSSYEDRTRFFLPRRTYTLIRIDGKAFHSYVKKIGSEKPYDWKLMGRMDATTKYLCENIQGAQLAYVQSDEISILLTDFTSVDTDAWFDGNIQKIASLSSSLATAFFNSNDNPKPEALACFDARVFSIPDSVEVLNYFRWRYQDWTRNSIQMLARFFFSQKQLHGKGVSAMHEMLYSKGENWAKQKDEAKNGRWCIKTDKGWKIQAAPDPMKNKEMWEKQIPKHGYEKK